MISIFLHLLALGYGTVHFRGLLAIMPLTAMVLWSLGTIILWFRTVPDLIDAFRRRGQIPGFGRTQNVWQWSLVVWILALHSFADPLRLLLPDWLEKMPQLLPMLASTFLYIFLSRPVLFQLFLLFRPILDEEQTPAEFFRARMTMPILFFPPLLLWTAVEDLAMFGGTVEELQDVRLLIVAPFFFIFLYLTAPRLFNWAWRAEPMRDEGLCEEIRQLCQRAQTPITGVKIWDTFREPVPNAAVAGLSQRFRFVYVTDYLLELFSRSQVLGVIAHELAHLRLGHVFNYMLFSLDLVFASIAVKLAVLLYLPAWSGGSALQDGMEMLLFLFVFAFSFTALARECEYQADAFAATLTGRENFAGGLETLERNILPPPKSIPAWLLTHPEIGDRVNKVRSWCGSIDDLLKRSRKIRLALLVVAVACFIAAMPTLRPVWQMTRLADAVQAGNLAPAFAALDSLPEQFSDHPLVSRERGRLAMMTGRWDMAILQAAATTWNLNFRVSSEELHHSAAPEVALYLKFMQFMLQTLDLG